MKWDVLENLPDTKSWEKRLLADEEGKVLGVGSVLRDGKNVTVSPGWMQSRIAQYAEISDAPDLTKPEKEPEPEKKVKEPPKKKFSLKARK